jgi:hypothetical protein
MAGFLDDEMLMALSAKGDRRDGSAGQSGLRFPFPRYGIQQGVRAGTAVSYSGRTG